MNEEVEVMLMEWFVVIAAAALGLLAVWQVYIKPSLHIKEFKGNITDCGRYCLIDIRDFISAYRRPAEAAQNIPLPYLQREAKSNAVCQQDIVLICEGRRAARIAARILNRYGKNEIFYVTV